MVLLNGHQADLAVRAAGRQRSGIEYAQTVERRLCCRATRATVGHWDRRRHAGVEHAVAVPVVVYRCPQLHGVVHAGFVACGAHLQHPAVVARGILPCGEGARADIAAFEHGLVRRGVVGRLQVHRRIKAGLNSQVSGHGVACLLHRSEGCAGICRGRGACAALRDFKGRGQLEWPSKAHRLVVARRHAETYCLPTLLDVHDVRRAVDLSRIGHHAAQGVGQSNHRLVGRVGDQAAVSEGISRSADQGSSGNVAAADLLQRQGRGHAVVAVQGVTAEG